MHGQLEWVDLYRARVLAGLCKWWDLQRPKCVQLCGGLDGDQHGSIHSCVEYKSLEFS